MAKLDTTQISALLTVPIEDWILINERVGILLAPSPLGGLYYQQFASIPMLDELLNVCRTWNNSTWPLACEVVSETNTFATRLNGFLQTVLDGGGDVDTLKNLASDATGIQKQTETFKTESATFANVNKTADTSPARHTYSTNFVFHDINPDPTAVSDAALQITLGWGNIVDDMTQAIKAMEDAEKGFGGFMSRVEIETAVADWKTVADKFKDLKDGMGEAASGLTGEIFYEGTTIREDGTLYHVRLDHPYEPTALAVGNNGSLVVETFDASDASQKWSFSKNGFGWILMSNSSPNYSGYRADVTNSASYAPVMTNTGRDTGTNYRIIKVDNHSLRIVNLDVELGMEQQRVLQQNAVYLGEPGVLNWNYLVEDDTTQSIQTWKFTEA
ncbi:hypothetical protein [Desulfobacter sp.]|uniref:hypothetical protein n=1 Tax=Desulfobacter sp. TaxID=2294 RepID=UPI003D0F07AB